MVNKYRFTDVHNNYKVLSYVASYFSKSEYQTSEVLRQAVKEIGKQNLKASATMSKYVYFFCFIKTNISAGNDITL